MYFAAAAVFGKRLQQHGRCWLLLLLPPPRSHRTTRMKEGGERTVRPSFSYFCTFALFSVLAQEKRRLKYTRSTAQQAFPLLSSGCLRPRRAYDK